MGVECCSPILSNREAMAAVQLVVELRFAMFGGECAKPEAIANKKIENLPTQGTICSSLQWKLPRSKYPKYLVLGASLADCLKLATPIVGNLAGTSLLTYRYPGIVHCGVPPSAQFS